MSESEFNLWAPPVTGQLEPLKSADIQPLAASGRFQIHGHIILLKAPYELPPVCFLSGHDEDLTKSRFRIPVRPHRSLVVLLLLGSGILLATTAGVQLMFGAPNSFPLRISTVAVVWLLLTIFGGLSFDLVHGPRDVTVKAWFDRRKLSAQRENDRIRFWWIAALSLLALAAYAVIAVELTGIAFGVVAVFLASLLFLSVSIVAYRRRNRKPWFQIRGRLRKDDWLEIRGVSPLFIHACNRFSETNP